MLLNLILLLFTLFCSLLDALELQLTTGRIEGTSIQMDKQQVHLFKVKFLMILLGCFKNKTGTLRIFPYVLTIK